MGFFEGMQRQQQKPQTQTPPFPLQSSPAAAQHPHTFEEVQPWLSRETLQLLTASSFQTKLKIKTQGGFGDWGGGSTTALAVPGAGQQMPPHIIIIINNFFFFLLKGKNVGLPTSCHRYHRAERHPPKLLLVMMMMVAALPPPPQTSCPLGGSREARAGEEDGGRLRTSASPPPKKNKIKAE